MAYCQECGSEVAQIDVFCPFCGIALPAPIDEIKDVTGDIAPPPIVETVDNAGVEDWEVTPVKPLNMPFADESFSLTDKTEDVNLREISADDFSATIVDRTPPKKVVKEPKVEAEKAAEKVEFAEIKAEIAINTEPEIDEEVEKAEFTETPKPEINPQPTENETLAETEVEENIEQAEVIESDKNVEIEEPLIEQKQIETDAELDDKNFDEEFEKLIEHPKGEISVEKENEIDDIQPQKVDNSETKSDAETYANPFESTVSYSSDDVKDLNLSDLQVVEFAEVTPNSSEIVEAEKLAEVNEEVAVEDDFPATDGGFVRQEIETAGGELPIEHNLVETPVVEENHEAVEQPETVKSEPKVVEPEPILENLAPVLAVPIIAPIIAESIAEEKVEKVENVSEVKERYTGHVGEPVDTGGGKSKLKPLSEGTVLNGRYEIVRKIGGGGMGAVYLASDRNLGGVLRAVKEMVQSHIEDEHQEKAISDFKRESMLLTSLEHPSIPTIYDYFFDERENRFYLVMKYISGGDLSGRLRSAPENRLDEKTITEWAIQVADVLDYLHSREPPIVYRDLKPSNVMIDGNSGRVMLIDFGIARWVSAKEEKGVTAVGTMGYAPPELFSGNVEPRSDIYSLGSTMFHLLTGADPQNSPLLIFDFSKNPRPRQINSILSDQMEQILLRSVEYDADKRFANAAELREVLINHLDNIRSGKLTFGISDGISAVGFTGGQMVFCGFCGQKIVASDMFCPFCGAKQATGQMSASSPIPSSVYNVPNISAKLHLIGTNDLASVTYNLEKDNNLIGRRDPMSNIFPEVDLSKYDPQTKISRRHARLWREGDTFMVEDLGSSNGTELLTAFSEKLRLLPHQPRVIAHGDKINIGDTRLHFVVG